jgi:hypothetical protein
MLDGAICRMADTLKKDQRVARYRDENKSFTGFDAI